MRIYCDTGAFREELHDLEKSGRISLHQFRYENRNRKIRKAAIPSKTQYRDFENYTYGELENLNPDGPTTDDVLVNGIGSKFSIIQEIIGAHNRRDAQHLDSAQMTKCKVFLTSDKKDIWSKKDKLLFATGLHIFLIPLEWNDFLAYIESTGRSNGPSSNNFGGID
jgi:hypothetical protein